MSKIPFFINLTASERMQIAEFAQIFIADTSEAIIEKGASDNCFYVLLSGGGDVCVDRGDEPVAQVKPGDIFGEIGFILNAPRTTWVIANKMSALLRIDKKLLSSLDFATCDKMKDQIILKLAQSVQAANERR